MRKYVKTFESFVSGDKEAIILITSSLVVSSYLNNQRVDMEELIQRTSKQTFDSFTEKEKYIEGLERGVGIETDSVSYRSFTDTLPYKVCLDPAYDEDEESSDLFNDEMDDIELDESGVECHIFYSLEDLEAFCKGIDDAEGWESVEAVSEEEFEQYIKNHYTPEEQQKILGSIQ